jgi:integrase
MNQNLTDQCGAEKNSEIIKEFLEYRKANSKGENTLKSDKMALNLFNKFTNNKPSKDTERYINSLKSPGNKTNVGSKLILFFRWFQNKSIKEGKNKLTKRERPDVMRWFEYPSAKLRRKNADPDIKKQLITPEEYKKIQQFVGRKPKWSALFETLYLSGGRPNEVNEMNVGDVEIDSEGKVTITLRKSKTIARKVPLPENPKMLIRWLQYHPFKDDEKAPLFISDCPKTYQGRMQTMAINQKLYVIIKYTGIKKTICPKCFRKTRASIMFSARTKDGGIIYDDTEMGQYFGWTPNMVVLRRQQYDLRNFDDLKEKIHGKIVHVETFDTIKQERDTLKQELENLKSQIGDLTKAVSIMNGNNVAFKEVNCGLQDDRLILK